MTRRNLVPAALAFLLWFPAAAGAQTVDMKVSLSNPLVLAGQPQTGYLKVGMLGTGFGKARPRATANLVLVIDRSGSMAGAKLERAKEAAIQAVARLSSQDIVSVVAFDDRVNVLLPATRASDKEEIYRAIRQLRAGNSTALFAGVSRGAGEVRKFLTRSFANRIILISDGLANVGPSSTEALASLGASLRKEGIAVTTLGLGLDYNEDLLYHLAKASDGNHAFVENATDLARIFDSEFGDVLSVAATDVEIRIAFAPGVRPLRLLGRAGEIVGQTVVVRLNQLLGQQEKYALVEFSAPARPAGETVSLAEVRADFTDVGSGRRQSQARAVSARFCAERAEVERAEDREVMVAAVEQLANERSKEALALRDRGLIEDARAALRENERFLSENAGRLKSERLRRASEQNRADQSNLDGDWNRTRKSMRRSQYFYETQQSY